MATRPYVGFSPTTPQKLAGIRIDPAPSDPTASGTNPAAPAAPLPALDPAVVRPRFHGLRVMPYRGLQLIPCQPNSGIVVMPTITAPARRRPTTTGASSVAM